MRPFHLPRTVRETVVTGAVLGLALPVAFLALQTWAGLRLGPAAAESADPATAPQPTPSASPHELAGRLLFPVPVVSPSAMRDSFGEPRGSRTHHAVDIPAPRGSPVVAVSDGTLASLSSSPAGGTSLYLLDASGRYCYLYAHLLGYAEGLTTGQVLRRGQVLAYVGSSGNAPPQLPHLHFAIATVLAPGACWGGPAVDPYPLWR